MHKTEKMNWQQSVETDLSVGWSQGERISVAFSGELAPVRSLAYLDQVCSTFLVDWTHLSLETGSRGAGLPALVHILSLNLQMLKTRAALSCFVDGCSVSCPVHFNVSCFGSIYNNNNQKMLLSALLWCQSQVKLFSLLFVSGKEIILLDLFCLLRNNSLSSTPIKCVGQLWLRGV